MTAARPESAAAPQPAPAAAHNRLSLSATLAAMAALRYTPAGVPALDLVLEHQSAQIEAGQARSVAFQLKAIGFGALAQTLARLNLGAALQAQGFLAQGRNGKGVVFHIQDFKPI